MYANAATPMKMTGNKTPRTMPRVLAWLGFVAAEVKPF
jgi:hypothetical protein